MAYKTTSGIPCQSPLEYEGKRYDACIGLDNGGIPWCYTDHSKKIWGNCETYASVSFVKGTTSLIIIIRPFN